MCTPWIAGNEQAGICTEDAESVRPGAGIRHLRPGRSTLPLQGIDEIEQRINQCCGSGSGSPMFLGLPDPDPLVRKTLILTILWLLYDFLTLKNDVNVA